MTPGHSQRWPRFAFVVLACWSALAFACTNGSKSGQPATAMATDINGIGTVSPVTATPRPANVVVEPEPSLIPDASASRTLVLRSGSTSLAVNTDTGNVSEIMQSPPAADNSLSYGLFAQFPFVFSPDGASYVFACDATGSRPAEGHLNNLCRARAGNTSAEIVVREGSPETYGAYSPFGIQWSPDGRRIAYRKRNRDNAEASDVYVLDLATLVATRVITSPSQERWGPVAWSPDGTRFHIQRQWSGTDAGTEMLVLDASTGQSLDFAKSLAQPKVLRQFAWSPDGTHVAFTNAEPNEPYDASLYVVAADGGDAVKVMDGSIADENLVWSPDGKWIAVTVIERDSTTYDSSRVFVVRADGSEERALPDALTSSYSPVWAPDSSHMAVRGSVGARPGIVVTSIRGAAPVVVDGDLEAVPVPDVTVWSADGKRLFFVEEGFCGQGGCTPGYLYMVDVANGAPPRRVYEQPINQSVSRSSY